jgi:WD40 repeat protein
VLYREAGVANFKFWDFEDSGRYKDWGDGIPNLPLKALRTMRFSHDNRSLFMITQTLASYCNFNVYKPSKGKTFLAVSDSVERFVPRDIAWSGDDRLIWVCGMNGQILTFDPIKGNLKNHWTGHKSGPVNAIAAFHKGRTVISGSSELCMWDGESGKLLKTITLPPK